MNFSSVLVSFSFVLLTLLWTFWIDFFSLFNFVYVSSLKSPNVFEVKFLILGLTLQQSQYLFILKLKSYDFLETLCCLAFFLFLYYDYCICCTEYLLRFYEYYSKQLTLQGTFLVALRRRKLTISTPKPKWTWPRQTIQ